MATVSFFVGWEIKDKEEAKKVAEILDNLPEKDLAEIGISSKFEKDIDIALERGKKLVEKWEREGIFSEK